MTDRYTNADLDAAENKLVAAGHDGEAAALRQYTEGIRNLVQGEWGRSFVTALERLNDQQTQRIADAVSAAVRAEVTAAIGPFRREIAEIKDRLDRKRDELDDFQAWRREMTTWRAEIDAKLEQRGDG